MTDNQIVICHKTARLGERSLEFEYPIKSAFLLNDRLVILFDPNVELEWMGQFANLQAFDLTGTRLWVAELPTNQANDYYYMIVSQDPLIAYAFTSFDCRIDPDNGKIVERVFTK